MFALQNTRLSSSPATETVVGSLDTLRGEATFVAQNNGVGPTVSPVVGADGATAATTGTSPVTTTAAAAAGSSDRRVRWQSIKTLNLAEQSYILANRAVQRGGQGAVYQYVDESINKWFSCIFSL